MCPIPTNEKPVPDWCDGIWFPGSQISHRNQTYTKTQGKRVSLPSCSDLLKIWVVTDKMSCLCQSWENLRETEVFSKYNVQIRSIAGNWVCCNASFWLDILICLSFTLSFMSYLWYCQWTLSSTINLNQDSAKIILYATNLQN